MEAASWLVEWIKGEIIKELDKAFAPIKNGINSFIDNIFNLFQTYYQSESGVDGILDNDYLDILNILMIAIDIIMLLVSPFATALSMLLNEAFTLIIDKVIAVIGGALSDKDPSIFDNVFSGDTSTMIEPFLLIFGINTQLPQFNLIPKVMPKVKSLINTIGKIIDNKIKQFGLFTIIILAFNTLLALSSRFLELPQEVGVFTSLSVAAMTFYAFYIYISKISANTLFQIIVKAGIVLYTIYNLFDFLYYLIAGNFFSEEVLPSVGEVIT